MAVKFLSDQVRAPCMDSSKKTFPPVGRCIYCYRTGVALSDEHIVAYAIGGKYILPKSTCKRCQKLTAKLEEHCFGETLRPFRAQYGLKPRHKNRIITEHGLTMVHSNGRVEIVQTPISAYPAFLALPHFKSLPTILEGGSPNPDVLLDAWGKITNSHIYKQLPEGTKFGYVPFHPMKWCRMLAKIAHGVAVANIGIGGFKPLLPRLIRGFDKTPTHLIGCTEGFLPTEQQLAHRVDLMECKSNSVPNKKFLLAKMRLFANCGSPEYIVVIGELS